MDHQVFSSSWTAEGVKRVWKVFFRLSLVAWSNHLWTKGIRHLDIAEQLLTPETCYLCVDLKLFLPFTNNFIAWLLSMRAQSSMCLTGTTSIDRGFSPFSLLLNRGLHGGVSCSGRIPLHDILGFLEKRSPQHSCRDVAATFIVLSYRQFLSLLG